LSVSKKTYPMIYERKNSNIKDNDKSEQITRKFKRDRQKKLTLNSPKPKFLKILRFFST